MKPGAIIILAALLVVVLVFATGCAGPWHRTGGTDADLHRDDLQCEYESKAATVSAAINDAIGAGITHGQLWIACMRARGWER